MTEQILETWQINNRVNLMLIDAISEEGLHCTLSKRGGGTAAKQFTHLHNLRLLRLERFAPEHLNGQTRIAKDEAIDKALLKARLRDSGIAIGAWIDKSAQDDGKIKGFKRGVIAMLGYFIAHEAHHRGNILLTLKQSGHRIPRDIQYGIWAWNQI